MKNILLVLTCVIVLSSCQKFLQQPSYNNVNLDEVFQDFQGARTTMVGAYDKLKSINYYLRDFYVYADLAGGNIRYSRQTNQALWFTYAFTRDAVNNDLKNYYQQAYSTVYVVNNVINFVDRAADATAFQKNRLRADAYAIRALVYFDLVRVFAQPYNFTPDASHPGVVLKTTNTPVTEAVPGPSSVKAVYDQVLSDLEEALTLYSNSTDVYGTGNSHSWWSPEAVKALRSRVNLYRENWSEVIADATEVISTGKFPLTPNSQYVASWSGKTVSSESIFELNYGNSPGGSLGDYYNPQNSLNGQFAATEDLLRLYDANDVRGRLSLFVTAVNNGSTFYFTKKYQGMADSANNIKIIRASELYLNRAEAYAHSGNLTAALADLSTIRKRANLSATNFSSTDPQAVIDEILLERRRELAFEGQLFFDIGRNKKDLIRNDCTAAICSFSYPDPLYAYPKPSFE